MGEESDFWKGWREALEALQIRIEAMQKILDGRARPHDVLLDVQNVVTELKTVSMEVDYGTTSEII